MTLISANRNVPEWKLSSRSVPLRIVTGADGTGDLYNLANIANLVQRAGMGTVDIVTADGGFDFSGNYNLQEKLSLRLIAAEVLAALQLQAPGGTFFLKVYDLRLKATLGILSILTDNYETVTILKPMSSRPANSEKYLLCSRFKPIHAVNKELRALQTQRLRMFVQAGEHSADSAAARELLSRLHPALYVMRNLIAANTAFIRCQIENISKTLSCIRSYDGTDDEDKRRHMLESLCDAQVRKSLAWCRSYRTGISPTAVKTYRIRTV
jgi:hypothetical protein